MIDLIEPVVAHEGDALRMGIGATPGRRPLELHIAAGERVALVGANGSGKSTLLKAICGVAPLQAGSIWVDGMLVAGDRVSPSGQPRRDLARRIAFVGQDPDDQIVASTVLDDVVFGPCNMGIDAREAVARGLAALDAVCLGDRAGDEVSALSGGMRQRLALAGALAMDCPCLLLDEPLSMVDLPSRLAFLDAVREWFSVGGRTILHVTHDLDDVLDYDRVAVVEAGGIVWCGTPSQVIENPEIAERAACRLPPVAGARASMRSPRKGEADSCKGLIFEDVSYAYPSRGRRSPRDAPLTCLDHVTVAFPPGSITLLTGANGAGKSTLLKLACGLLEAGSGIVSIMDEKPRPGDVGMVSQRCAEQLFAASVLDDVAFGPTSLGVSRQEAAERAARSLRLAGLDPDRVGPRNPHLLSGGQMRRVALAGILAVEPKALLFDEPTVGLDRNGCSDFERLVEDLAGHGTPVVVATNDLPRLLSLADHLIVLDRGRVAYWGPMGPRGIAALEGAGLVPVSCTDVAGGVGVGGGCAEAAVGPASAHPQPLGAIGRHRNGRASATPDSIRAARRPDVTLERQKGCAALSANGSPQANGLARASRRGLDARVKLILLLVGTVSLFAVESPAALAALVALGVVAALRAGVPSASVRRAMLGMTALLASLVLAASLRFDGTGDIGLPGGAGLSFAGLAAGGCAVMRIAVMVAFSLAVSEGTPRRELSDALDALLLPLGRFRLPVDELSGVLSMSLRFIPVMWERFRSIADAQRCRGAAVGEGGPLRRVTSWIPVLVPVLVSLFRRAEELSFAMTVRGYGTGSRTRLSNARLRPMDMGALIGGCLACLTMTLVF